MHDLWGPKLKKGLNSWFSHSFFFFKWLWLKIRLLIRAKLQQQPAADRPVNEMRYFSWFMSVEECHCKRSSAHLTILNKTCALKMVRALPLCWTPAVQHRQSFHFFTDRSCLQFFIFFLAALWCNGQPHLRAHTASHNRSCYLKYSRPPPAAQPCQFSMHCTDLAWMQPKLESQKLK